MKNKRIKLNNNQKKIIIVVLIIQLFLIILGLILSVLVYEGVL